MTDDAEDAILIEAHIVAQAAEIARAIEVLRRQIQQRTASGARRMVSLRPDEAESLLSLIDDFFLGTCDWGDCDRLAVDTRFDHDKGSLPVCVQHSLPYALWEAEDAKLMSMVEKAASTLRDGIVHHDHVLETISGRSSDGRHTRRRPRASP